MGGIKDWEKLWIAEKQLIGLLYRQRGSLATSNGLMNEHKRSIFKMHSPSQARLRQDSPLQVGK